MPKPAGRTFRTSSELRTATKVAWMYHVENCKQDEIATELHLSQSKVSRLLKAAAAEGIVVTTVVPPAGVFTELEASVEEQFGIEECVIVEARESESAVVNDLGIAAAGYLSSSFLQNEVIGISSWSATWVSAIRQLRPFRSPVARNVVQLVGGVGNQAVQTQATLLLDRLARTTGGEAAFMQTPGLLGDGRGREVLLNDPAITPVTDLWDKVSLALLGIGSVDPSPLLLQSGNALPQETMTAVAELGGVGDICHRFFDASGNWLRSGVDDRVVGITPQQLLRIPRRVAAAGGTRKHQAILGALRGGWITTLITDADTATAVLQADQET